MSDRKLMMKKIKQNTPVSLLLLAAGLLFTPQVFSSADCIAYLQYTGGYWQVWLMDEQGNKQKQITHSLYDKSSFSWYPDTENFLVNSNQGELYKVDIKTGKELKLNIGLKGMFDVALSPNGKNVVFGLSTSGSRDDHNIWQVNLKTRETHKLTNLKQMQHMPKWSADGEWVYFSSKADDQHNDILRVQARIKRPDGEKSKKIETMTANALYNFDAVESIKGELLFSSNRTGSYEIWKQDKSGKLSQLTQRPARDARPAWSADGSRVAFESSQGGKMNIWTMEQDINPSNSNKMMQITHAETGARFPVWSPGDKAEKPQRLCD